MKMLIDYVKELGMGEFLIQLIMIEKGYSRDDAQLLLEEFVSSKWCHSIFSLDELIEYRSIVEINCRNE